MKKQFYILFFFLLAGFMSQAQFKKGDVLLGGDLNLSTQSGTGVNPYSNKQTSFGISPSVGKFINENTLVGIQAGYSYQNTKQDNSGSTIQTVTDNTYSAGVFMRRYKSLGSHFYVFLQPSLLAFCSTEKSSYSDNSQMGTKNNAFNINLGLAPGMAYSFNDKLMLELSFQNLVYTGYGHSKQSALDAGGNPINSYKTNGFNIGTGLNNGSLSNINVGFRILFGHKSQGA
jgi:hypothetical protein